jgi:predicted dehydrogenase
MESKISRRTFMQSAAAGSTLVGFTARSYARILGANDRIGIGLIGCGDRGVRAHLAGILPHAKTENIDVVAVSDPWRIARESAMAFVKEGWGQEPKLFISHRNLLEVKEVDAVMIASCDHLHARQLEAAAMHHKDAYCEKPIAKNLSELNRAVDAVKKSGIVVQIGTQLRSLPSMTGCREVYRSGVLGKVARIEQCRNGSRPYWYQYIKDARKEDVDWQEFWMGKPQKPFDSVLFTGWYGYRYFSDGMVPGFGSHFIDLVHYITGARFPRSCVCQGGIYTWKDQYQFTCHDNAQALWDYSGEFLVSYSTNFGNDSANSFKFLGDQGTMKLENWNAPSYSAEGGSKNKGVIRGVNDIKPIERPDHFLNWLQCLRSRETPHAPIEAGYQHGVAVIMAMVACDTGRRIYFDPEKRAFRHD